MTQIPPTENVWKYSSLSNPDKRKTPQKSSPFRAGSLRNSDEKTSLPQWRQVHEMKAKVSAKIPDFLAAGILHRGEKSPTFRAYFRVQKHFFRASA